MHRYFYKDFILPQNYQKTFKCTFIGYQFARKFSYSMSQSSKRVEYNVAMNQCLFQTRLKILIYLFRWETTLLPCRFTAKFLYFAYKNFCDPTKFDFLKVIILFHYVYSEKYTFHNYLKVIGSFKKCNTRLRFHLVTTSFYKFLSYSSEALRPFLIGTF